MASASVVSALVVVVIVVCSCDDYILPWSRNNAVSRVRMSSFLVVCALFVLLVKVSVNLGSVEKLCGSWMLKLDTCA